MKTLLDKTIWAQGAIPFEEWKYRNAKRILFPVYDLLMIFAGLAAWRFGVPTLLDFYPSEVVQIFGIMFTIASVMALVGVSFPARWKTEIIGMSVKLGLTVIYLFTLLLRAFVIDESRLFGFFFVSATIAVVAWRISLLGNEWQTRRLERKL